MPGAAGGLALALLRVGVWGHSWLSPGCPLPESGAFPGSLPTAILPGRLQQCWWERGLQGLMDNGRANGARQGQQRWGLEPLQRGQQLGRAGLLVAKMGSQLPG